MKKLSKKLALMLISFGITASLLTSNVSAQSYIEESHLQYQNVSITDHAEVTPFAPIIDWRYKVVDGKLYRRQYNYSTQQWIGEWELC